LLGAFLYRKSRLLAILGFEPSLILDIKRVSWLKIQIPGSRCYETTFFTESGTLFIKRILKFEDLPVISKR
jgi:hypothetical protein